jgi:ABC-type nitrate/sulfonate/bicarbonate transport system substrate-binding protein
MNRPAAYRRPVLLGLLLLTLLGAAGCTAPSHPVNPKNGGQRKADVKDLALGDELEVPYILWGGDVATFLANGGETTAEGSAFRKQGLKLRLARGDDFAAQVAKYKDGKTPFLRGTMSMIGQVSEDLGEDARTRPVVFLQLTWSAGDHVVARPGLRTLDDLKGKKIALQKGGPHVGMLQDVLHTARLSWKDVTVVWTDDVTGDKGPAALFRKDNSVDACFAITPDMMGLTGGPDKVGSGEGGTVRDAHVLVSTAQMLRSIADVYACRQDYYDAHKDVVEKFVAGYLKGAEDLVAMRKAGKEGAPTPAYQDVLRLTRKMYGDDVKTDDEADGLIADAVFVGLPGNYAFFKDEGNLSGFKAKRGAALDVALALGDAKQRSEFPAADLDYGKVRSLGDLRAAVTAPPAARFADNPKEKNTIYSFQVHFKGGQYDFPEAQYRDDFQRAVEQASLFGNAVISVKGHANPAELTEGFKNTVVSRGLVTQRQGKFFRKDGTEFDMNDMKQIVAMIKAENLGGVRVPGQENFTMQQHLDELQKLSEQRAAAVREAVVKYAKNRGYRLDASQIKSAGLGGLEPIYVHPKNDPTEGQANRRVEFRIIAVGVEAINAAEFDY